MSSSVPPLFSADLVREDGMLRLILAGELDVATIGELERALPEPAPGEVLVFDLRQLLFLDSSGVHLLMRLDVASRAEGWSLVIVRGPREVQHLLDLCHIGERIRMVDSPADAVPADG